MTNAPTTLASTRPTPPARSIGTPWLRRAGLALCIGLLPAGPALAQLAMEFNIQGAGIGIHLSNYPSLVRVPGYPVYYAPNERANYFFYEGLYWVYADDTWYDSRWYNGPWARVERDLVPLFLLRVPVRYYRQPPAYFRPWRADAAPRWAEHWGNDWAQRRPGWDQWNRRDVPRAAPLPTYQRAYPGPRYPAQPERQEAIRAEHERPAPHPNVTRPAPRSNVPIEAQRPQPQQRPPAQPPFDRSGPAHEAAPVHGANPAPGPRGREGRGEQGGDKGGGRSRDQGSGQKSGERDSDRR